ncbi:hypothetical protein [Mycoplasma mycoides]|uniref:Uncharacterized protein n=1 Tax=Mycoplasma mycoides subsp. mycoides TaxID=2103 RepID=A0AAE2EHK9_MYCMY|nr:hypothetical protein [Mycoplasma mycoides]ADK69403.1 conserved hypothetical protein [Mycoplasma mycoides subsp. mycoides SC str. Gladysdale]AIZ55014.1 hypothetical protein mycmycITA_00184 [Mycoplasma mycoides subsp. mycoides]AME10373.1 hypothetical protein MmmBen_0173 [Mycoplasma mycoides subsp. mycoides]AME11380.1 hypothetical protein MmmBen50_0171 [Mycoplasma mycoides subsp. mycoides]AME12401.1 hypothetical protein MmmBen181_0178 [Mycoplasma mycoides subsp. mycoides]
MSFKIEEKIKPFLEMDLSKLELEDKTKLFLLLSPPINYGIKKAMSKFHSLPLEHHDLMSYAWIAFDELLQVYQAKNIKKKFIWSVIDAVTWKCIDACTKYINNRHKVLNMSLSNSIKQEHLENIVSEEDYMGYNFAIEEIIDLYFKNCNDKLAKPIFEMYIRNVPKKHIFTKFNISRNKLKKIIEKTTADLKKIIEPLID